MLAVCESACKLVITISLHGLKNFELVLIFFSIVALPDIRKSKTTDVAHIHNDYLPQEVMLALTQPADLTTKSMVPSRDRALAVSTVSDIGL